jgi:hypothetical protein
MPTIATPLYSSDAGHGDNAPLIHGQISGGAAWHQYAVDLPSHVAF